MRDWIAETDEVAGSWSTQSAVGVGFNLFKEEQKMFRMNRKNLAGLLLATMTAVGLVLSTVKLAGVRNGSTLPALSTVRIRTKYVYPENNAGAVDVQTGLPTPA